MESGLPVARQQSGCLIEMQNLNPGHGRTLNTLSLEVGNNLGVDVTSSWTYFGLEHHLLTP